jgi:transposase
MILVPRGVKKRAHEKLTDSNITHVIQLLNAESPITKKHACEVLNISYNTTRLSTIIEEFKENKEYRDKRKTQNRGKPASKNEIATAAESYLEGETISEIAKRMYRSPSFIKNIIERVGVPQKAALEEKGIPFLPDACVKETFSPKELVWSAYYNKPAKITKEEINMDYEGKYGAKCYTVYVYEMVEWNPDMFVSGWVGDLMGGFYASQLAYDLGSLEHLQSYGVNIKRLQG